MKKYIAAATALIMILSLAGCNDKTNNGNNSNAEESGNADLSSAETNVGYESDAVSDDPIENASYVVDQYMKYANFEFNESMLKLMTPTMQKSYKDAMENEAHDHGFDEHDEDMLTGVTFVADKENSKILDKINIEEDYKTAVELVGYVLFKDKGEEQADDVYAILIETQENNWQIAFIGDKNQAYFAGIIEDEKSAEAIKNAESVYNAAQKACESLDGKYEFNYLNYVSSEKDKFVDEIKKNLSDDLKDSSFTVFMKDQNLDYVVWSENSKSNVIVRYPVEK